jgi:toxin YhaV
MTEAHGWNLYFHACLIDQLSTLQASVQRAQEQNPQTYQSNANYKLFKQLSRLIYDVIPLNPNSDAYRQGNTMGKDFRHWRRAKFGGRFRLFFRFDSSSRVIVFALSQKI